MGPARIFNGILLVFCLFSAAYSADLYLLDIDSYRELGTARRFVDHARGRIGSGFVVDLDKTTAGDMAAEGLKISLLAEDIDFNGVYYISRIHPEPSQTVLAFEPLVSADGRHLVELAPAEAGILKKDRYTVIPVSGLETPLFYNPPVVMAEYEDYYPLDTLADRVSQDSLYSYDTRLEAFQTRYITTDSILAARDWLISKFQEFGYTEVSTDVFYYTSGTTSYGCYNVLCYKQGSAEPDKLIVIGGHYDSINHDSPPTIYAPGADDNASGTAVVLEIARILKDVDTRKSYLFAAFTAEEVGLFGSQHVASNLYDENADVECMLNFDMVAYSEDAVNDVTFFSGSDPVYANVLAEAAGRVTTLLPYYGGAAGNSDHASFDDYGYLVAYTQEGDFNYDGWHTNLDISSRLDFPYFEEIVRMTAAAVGHIDVAASPTPIDEIRDIGDGQSLRLIWDNCDNTYSYKMLFGTQSGVYSDTVDLITPPCSYDLNGLETGVEYYFAVMGINPDGIGPLYLIENSGASYIEPRKPTGISAEPGYRNISLSWNPNMELDLSHYRLLRRPSGGTWAVLQDDLTETEFEDSNAGGHIVYEYLVQAIDNDFNLSDSSNIVSAMAATFDYPLLLVDETGSTGWLSPSESAQAAFYDSIFTGLDYDKVSVGTTPDRIDRITVGQYGSIFWVDDDQTVQVLSSSVDTLNWYLGYNNDLFAAGWQTIYYMATPAAMSPGGFLYDNFGISDLDMNLDFDFIGAEGQNGWPSVQTRTDNAIGGLFPNIPVFGVNPGAEVIYTFDSETDDPAFEGLPAGVAYDTPQGKRVALAFPLYHLTEAGAQALIARAAEYFGLQDYYLYGDVNHSGNINIMDVAYLISYLYRGGPAPVVLNQGDPDGNCETNILDGVYIINYLYRKGPEPQAGCIE
nr:M20/M25/M40 family metallo-hydrolase [candidate division Zixibacteria bacterium]